MKMMAKSQNATFMNSFFAEGPATLQAENTIPALGPVCASKYFVYKKGWALGPVCASKYFVDKRRDGLELIRE
jgi:hypothetical protein